MGVRAICCDEPLQGGDHFAPKYLVGNVPAGDPVTPQAAPFVYIPDPGDGSGIVAAIAAAAVTLGDVWIRPGTYAATWAGRPTIPANCRVWGAGRSTIIQSAAGDNCIFELAAGAELAWMQLVHGAAVAVVGTTVIQCDAPGVSLHDLYIDLSATASGGLLTSAISLQGADATRAGDSLERLRVLLPAGANGAENTWMRGVSCPAPGQGGVHIVEIDDLIVTGGDVAVYTRGADVSIEALRCLDQAVLGCYGNGGRLVFQGRQSIIDATKATLVAPVELLSSTLVMDGVRILNTIGVATTAIQVRGAASCDITSCDIASGFTPVIYLGNPAEAVTDSRVIGNKIASGAGVVPVALGSGTVNCIVALNVSRGSGGTLPTDLGTGNNIAQNVWGA